VTDKFGAVDVGD